MQRGLADPLLDARRRPQRRGAYFRPAPGVQAIAGAPLAARSDANGRHIAAVPWLYNRGYYATYYPRWRVELPTDDMLELATPEGVVEPGGSVTGFVYFAAIPRNVKNVTFTAQLTDGRTEERFGTIQIPFVR